MFKINDTVQVLPGSIYLNTNKEIPDSILNIKLYVREVKENSCVIARAKTGAILGEISNENLKVIDGNIAAIEPYLVRIPTDNIPLYNSANKNSGIIKRLNRFSLITIVDEKNNFGKIKVGAGWIDLSKVERI
jgi:uncharacterized protein YfaS (alpha-2-macroglobulin family)